MDIKFKDIASGGIVEARASLAIAPGVFFNEITILRRDGNLEVELPRKSFKGKNGKLHYIDLITFDDEDKEALWKLEVKEAYASWRKKNQKVLIYESN